MTSSDTTQRAADRAVFLAAAREHSAAVDRHLERIAVRLREHGGLAGAAPGVPSPLGGALADLSRLLLADTSQEGILAAVMALARSGVEGCEGASVTLLLPSGGVETAAATDDEVAAADRRQFTARRGPCYEAAVTGRAHWHDPHSAPDRILGGAWPSLLSVPLRGEAGVIGALNLYGRTPSGPGEHDAAVAELIADRAARALAQARVARAQQALATSLQRSLLPPELPDVPGLRLAARYRPASSGINVGGDWYDVLPLSRDRVVLVIGDVAGHGLAAAMTMAQVRTAVRAYALEGHDPATVLALVGRFLQRIDPDTYATCVVVELEPATGSVRWANAGHPDPVVIMQQGSARPLRGRSHLPALGAPWTGEGLRPATEALPPGSRLLLFTDGLVERRHEPIDAGLHRLERAAAALVDAEGDLGGWCEAVVNGQLGRGEVADDVAVLALERPSEVADPREIPRVTG